MKYARILIVMLATSLCAAVHAQAPPPSQVLVMLRAAPPHLHAADDYAVAYAASPDETARMHIARALAQQYGLQLVDNWPMRAKWAGYLTRQ